MIQPPPFTAIYDLAALPAKGTEINIVPSQSQRENIAHWLGIEAIGNLTATVSLTHQGTRDYAYKAHFQADVVQACVVTLEPVPSHISGEFQRLFRVPPKQKGRRAKAPAAPVQEIEIASLDESEPELLETTMLDAAAPLLEEISLALDPYPKAPGASFAPAVEEPDPSESPFAVLKQLKPGQGDKGR